MGEVMEGRRSSTRRFNRCSIAFFSSLCVLLDLASTDAVVFLLFLRRNSSFLVRLPHPRSFTVVSIVEELACTLKREIGRAAGLWMRFCDVPFPPSPLLFRRFRSIAL
jgi:hypothetical protein